jgi:hypothetical protein
MTRVEPVNREEMNSCRWSTKLIEVLNNRKSSARTGNVSCIQANRFRKPKVHSIIQFVQLFSFIFWEKMTNTFESLQNDTDHFPI